MNKINYVIIDDDDLLHDTLLDLMKIHVEYKCVGHFFDVVSASADIDNLNPDLIFLDVEMPNLNGFELLKYISKSIYVIITTSHKGYATESFEHEVSDFLTKPIRPERLFQILVRFKNNYNNSTNNNNSISVNSFSSKGDSEYIFVTLNKDFPIVKLNKSEICSIEKNGNNVNIFTNNNKEYFKDITIKGMIEELNNNQFVVINRATIINITKANWGKDIVEMKNGKTYKVTKSFFNK